MFDAASRHAGLTGPMLLVVLVCAALLGACSSPPEALSISILPADQAPARIRVAGLSTAEAAALGRANLDAAGWRSILQVTSDAGASVSVAGTYVVHGTSVEFQPAFPFDPGRRYTVRFDPARMPAARAAAIVAADVALPARPATPPVVVSAIYPSAEEWPANLLRFYVHFSGPMSRESGAGRVHLLDDTGAEVADALLPSAVDFWSPDQTRYTVFFEPGRVKRGIQPNRDEGRALVPGRRYTIAVDQAWPDASGRPIAEAYRRTFRAGPAREYPLSMESWRVSSPSAGSTDPLVVTVPAPLDRALLLRTLGVATEGQPLDGQVDVAKDETEWRFTPRAPWRRAAHALVVLSSLEDPSGNRIGRAFEVLPTDPAANVEPPERFTRPVTIR